MQFTERSHNNVRFVAGEFTCIIEVRSTSVHLNSQLDENVIFIDLDQFERLAIKAK
jgi:hypothetical protein